MPKPNEILDELKKIKYPGFTRDIVSFGIVKDIEVAYASVTVVLAMVPTKGIPLPMISFGGNSLVTTLALMGMLMNVSENTI